MKSSVDFSVLFKEQFNARLPFVFYRKPNTEIVNALLQKDNKLHKVESFKESGFVFAPFNGIEESVLFPLDNCRQFQTSGLKNGLKSDKFKGSSELYQFNLKANHVKLVVKAKDSIHSGQLKKVVLSRFEIFKLRDVNPFIIFRDLLKAYKKAFVYCWYHPKVGLWLGATPETLLKVEGIRFETMALAGTQLYEGKMDVDWEDKEREEQQMVTDFIVENLKPFIDILTVASIETVKAGNMLHLLTKISGALKLDKYNFKNVVNALHPTPAVCGIPRKKAKQFILDMEGYNREFYTGFLGELNFEEKSELYVNLRCMQLRENNAIIYVGGGITKDSNPEKEWFETVNKTNTMKKVLT